MSNKKRIQKKLTDIKNNFPNINSLNNIYNVWINQSNTEKKTFLVFNEIEYDISNEKSIKKTIDLLSNNENIIKNKNYKFGEI